MAKLAQTSTKYLIKARFQAKGMVEKPDVIGAIFGQTEGLLGPELDLRELQRTGKIGRVEVEIKNEKGRSHGEIIIPSSLDGTESALIAASMETIDRIGPCDAKITIETVNDLRTLKREYIIERAKEVLSKLLNQVPDINTITEELLQSVRSAEITEYKGLAAGPDITTSDDIIICEGRADVVNLLRHGVKNAIAVGGTAINPNIVQLSKEKEVTVFLDGDRGGDLILKSLRDMGCELDFIARAPHGKEVEELTKKEVFKALRDKIPAEQITPKNDIKNQEDFKERREKNDIRKKERTEEEKTQNTKHTKIEENAEYDEIKKIVNEQKEELIGSRAAIIFDNELQFIGRIPAKELSHALKNVQDVKMIMMDGDINNILLRQMNSKEVKYVYTTKKQNIRARNIKLLSGDLE